MKEPRNLYEPIHYILGLGGKGFVPLTLMTAEILRQIIKKALPAALAEVFHNFRWYTMILWMMRLASRTTTVHEKWDLNTGILSGDAMLILAYQYFESYQPKIFRKLAKTALRM
jgi:geranylgeranyl diphosphate synthase type II